MSSQSFLQIRQLAKSYSDAPGTKPVFHRVNVDIEKGEFVCIIGHSGCGKTTVLNMLAGLDAPNDGVIVVDGRAISAPSLDRAVIFQGHALLPWRTVMGNVAFAVSSRWPEWSRAKVAEQR